MQTNSSLFLSCLAVICCLEYAITEIADMSPNQPPHREKRFDLNALIEGLKSGSQFVNSVVKIFGLGNTDFGRVINSIAQFDAPTSTQVYGEFERLMKGEIKDVNMDQTGEKRAQEMMEVLKTNMENSGSALTVSFATAAFLGMTAVYCAN